MAKSKTTCPDECIGWTEEYLDSRLNESMYAHEASGAETLASIFRSEAGRLFGLKTSMREKCDVKAALYREIAEFTDDWAKERRKEQKKQQQATEKINDGSDD